MLVSKFWKPSHILLQYMHSHIFCFEIYICSGKLKINWLHDCGCARNPSTFINISWHQIKPSVQSMWLQAWKIRGTFWLSLPYQFCKNCQLLLYSFSLYEYWCKILIYAKKEGSVNNNMVSQIWVWMPTTSIGVFFNHDFFFFLI